MKYFALITAALLSLGLSASTFVEDALKPYVESGELPGAVAILIKPGAEEVACLGFADVDKGRKITLDDPFMQCSQTKGFCGVVVAKLVEDGVMSLDDPVSKYLPEFGTLWINAGVKDDMKTLVKAKNVLTVKNVLNHTGGFPFEICCKQAWIRGGGWSGGAPLRSVASIAANSPILFEPGTRQQYSNTGIDIAAACAEVATGKKFEVLVKEIITDPLEMTETTFKPTDEQIARKIEMYDCGVGRKATWRAEDPWEQRPYNDEHVFTSAGAGIWTTTRDQVKFYKMLMNLGLGDNGVRVLKEETVKSILAVSTRGAMAGGYSLGLVAPPEDNENGWFGHGGAFGTNCMVNYHKGELKLWVVQLRGGFRAFENVFNEAADKFFAETIDNSQSEAYTGRTE